MNSCLSWLVSHSRSSTVGNASPWMAGCAHSFTNLLWAILAQIAFPKVSHPWHWIGVLCSPNQSPSTSNWSQVSGQSKIPAPSKIPTWNTISLKIRFALYFRGCVHNPNCAKLNFWSCQVSLPTRNLHCLFYLSLRFRRIVLINQRLGQSPHSNLNMLRLKTEPLRKKASFHGGRLQYMQPCLGNLWPIRSRTYVETGGNLRARKAQSIMLVTVALWLVRWSKVGPHILKFFSPPSAEWSF